MRKMRPVRVGMALAVVIAVTVSTAVCCAVGAGGHWLAGGVSGIEVRPAIIQKELGRFLWLPDTRVGHINVTNRGTAPVVIDIQIAGISHTEDGAINVLPCSPEAVGALILSPAGPVTVMPGQAATVRLELDRAYANMPDRSGLCAALIITSAPVRAKPALQGLDVGSTVVLPVMIKFPWRDHARIAIVEAYAEGQLTEEGRPALTLKVANEGGAYVRVDGRVLVQAADGSRAAEAKLEPALALPGCVRAFRVKLEGPELPPGEYTADAQIRADGKAAGGARFTVSSLARP